MSRALWPLLVALAGCDPNDPVAYVPEGQAPVPPGEPAFVASQVLPGQDMRLTWADLAPGTVVFFGVSTGGGPGPCPPVMSGDCLDIGPSVQILGSTAANGDGVASLVLRAPQSLRRNMTLRFQAVALQLGSTYAGKSDVAVRPVGALACTAIYAPVCGVDGATYSNDCVAYTMGWPIDDYGPCP